jgi:hypothetical protein
MHGPESRFIFWKLPANSTQLSAKKIMLNYRQRFTILFWTEELVPTLFQQVAIFIAYGSKTDSRPI